MSSKTNCTSGGWDFREVLEAGDLVERVRFVAAMGNNFSKRDLGPSVGSSQVVGNSAWPATMEWPSS